MFTTSMEVSRWQIRQAVKGLVSVLSPLLKQLENSRKIFLKPVARYWLAPCCGDYLHHANYHLPGYLPRLGEAIHSLRDSIRDRLFTRRAANFRALCPNRMVGVGQMREEPTDEEAALMTALWGPVPEHPSSAAYRQMADMIETDLLNAEAHYTNPVKKPSCEKRPRVDLSLQRAAWVAGFSVATARRDLQVPTNKQRTQCSPLHGLSSSEVPTTEASLEAPPPPVEVHFPEGMEARMAAGADAPLCADGAACNHLASNPSIDRIHTRPQHVVP